MAEQGARQQLADGDRPRLLRGARRTRQCAAEAE